MTNAGRPGALTDVHLSPYQLVLITLVPRDGRLISLIAASKGVEDADERVIHQLLDFAHRECQSRGHH
jgi:hypothetical protein